jgi:hypothetical protein
MQQLTATPRKGPVQDDERKKSTWGEFLRRLAFWKVAKQEEMDRLFTEAVNELHPDWEKRRLANKVNHR